MGAVSPPLLTELRRRIESLAEHYSTYSGKRGAIQDAVIEVDRFAQEKGMAL
jgi:hypothetical protein